MTDDPFGPGATPWTILRSLQATSDLMKPNRKAVRRLRLFTAACYRRVWTPLLTESVRRAVEALESCADGSMTLKSLAAIAAGVPFQSLRDAATKPWVAATGAIHDAGRGAVTSASRLEGGVYANEMDTQAVLLRDIFGNTFRPASPIAEGVLAWSNGLVVKLAEAAYQHRLLPSGHLDPDRLAVLADALEDAGCTDDWLLGHLRSPGPHVRGCVGVDAVLGRD
jgi:hypothetical protein